MSEVLGKAFIELEARMDKLGKQLDDAQKQVDGKLQKIADGMTAAGQKMSVAITAPLVAMGTVAANQAKEVNSAQRLIQMEMGLTAGEAEKAGKVIENVFVNGIAQDVEQAKNAVVAVKGQMEGLSNIELEKVSEQALLIANTFDEDVNEVTRAASSIMKNFKLEGSEAMDTVAGAMQHIKDPEILDTLREYGPQFAEMGYSAEEMVSILESGMDAGAWSLDKVGDAIKESHLRMQDMSDATFETYEALGLSAEEYSQKIAGGGEEGNKAFSEIIGKLKAVESETERNAMATSLFGTTYEDLREEVIFALGDAEKNLKDFTGTTDKMKNDMFKNNPMKALEVSMRELNQAIGPLILEVTNVIVNHIVPAIKKFTDWFNSLSDEGKKTALIIAGIVAAIGPLLIVFAQIMPVFTGVISLIKGLSAAVGLLSKAMAFLAANPIILIIAAVIGLIALIVYLWKTNETFRNVIMAIWTAISDFFIAVWEKLKAVGEFIWDAIVAYITWYINTLKTIIKTVITVIMTIWETAWNGIKTAGEFIWNLIVGYIKWYIGTIRKIIETVLGVIKWIWEKYWGFIDKYVLGVAEKIWNGIEDNFNKVKDFITNTLSGIKDKATGWGRNIIDMLVNGIKSRIRAAKDAISGVVESIRNFLPFSPAKEGPLSTIDKSGPGLIDTLTEGIKKTAPQMEREVSRVMGRIQPALQTNLSQSVENPNEVENLNTTYEIGQLVVREEADIRRIAEELHTLQTRNNRARGGQ